MPHIKSAAKLKHKKFINFWAFYFGLFYVLLTIFAGFFDGLGKSPYSHSIKGLILNFIFVGSAILGRETIRSYLVNSITKQENYLMFIIISLLMTVTNFNFNKYMGLDSLQGYVKFFAEFLAPEFSHNLFATYLVYLGGLWSSIIYLGVIQGFHWFSPILPALKWINTALIGILCPIFFVMFFTPIYSKISKENVKKQQEGDSVVSWFFTSFISIGIIWFAVGVFPIYPSVIATGSMEPMIKPGDIIIVEKIKDEEEIKNLSVNDVIQFKRDNILISHRIIDIINDNEEGLQFKTKGDNNSAADTVLVKPQDIKGTIKHIVPKVGLLTLLLKSNNEVNLKEIMF
jgi:signal peptidase